MRSPPRGSAAQGPKGRGRPRPAQAGLSWVRRPLEAASEGPLHVVSTLRPRPPGPAPHRSSRGRHAVRTRILTLALALGVGACGGGGGAPSGSDPGALELGLVSSTTATTFPRSFRNPLGTTATVTLAPGAAPGPFSVEAGALPAPAPPAGELTLPVVFTPGAGAAAGGRVTGSVSLRFTGEGGVEDVTQTFVVDAEPVVHAVSPEPLDFGPVAAGSSLELSAELRNLSRLSPVRLSTAALPDPAFALLEPALPLTLLPGARVTARVRFSAPDDAPRAGALVLGLGEAGGPVRIEVTANSEAREEITDLGVVAFGAGGDTADLTVTVPADALSLSLEATAGAGTTLGLGLLSGPGGRVYENASSTGAYLWFPSSEVFTAPIPNTDRADLQLVPGGGAYTFRIRRLGGGAATARVRAVVERRPGGATSLGTLDLNVWLAAGLSVDAAAAPADPTLQAVLARIDAILEGQGLGLGAIDYYDVADPAYDFVTQAEFPALLRLSTAAARTRLNLFFVREAIGGGVVGVAGTIAGPKLNGTSVSGVMSVFEGFTTNTIGLVAAHELGHFLGLLHTAEQDGRHDAIDDTAECPASGTGTGVCATAGGGYLMHWLALGGTTLTPGQGLVIRGHPLVSPRNPGAPKPRFPWALPDPGAGERAPFPDEALPPGWCGTCATAPSRPR